MPGNGGIRWLDRPDDDGKKPIKKLTRTRVEGEGDLPKQARQSNAADRPPPKGYLAGILAAQKANDTEQAEIDALIAKMTGKHAVHSGDLSKREMELAQKLDRKPRAAGRLLGRKEKSAIKRVLEDPSGSVKKGAKAAGSKAATAAGSAVKRKWF